MAGRPGEHVPRSQHSPDRRPGRVVGRVSRRRGQGGRTGHRCRPEPSRSGRAGDGGRGLLRQWLHRRLGHGTHVASVVGGSGVGSGSGSTRRGVAPGAWLLVGKVLGDDGFGSSSQVIAGMEWAVEQGADVVTMSLGSSGASDGTDPMSLALNDLSRRSGALFVVAAGNDGEQGPRTVGSPRRRGRRPDGRRGGPERLARPVLQPRSAPR
ncbi:S8 family serine peptidase [Streptomyces globisporus]